MMLEELQRRNYSQTTTRTYLRAVACGPQKLDSSLTQRLSPASTRGAIHRALPCFGGRALPEGDDDGRSSVAMVGLGSECPDQDWCELWRDCSGRPSASGAVFRVLLMHRVKTLKVVPTSE